MTWRTVYPANCPPVTVPAPVTTVWPRGRVTAKVSAVVLLGPLFQSVFDPEVTGLPPRQLVLTV
ncbi:hypothetical protein [Streptomyces sp. NPDC096323]|uniref:hypothetical protein n=1 Tax=Streptomyces sp. NPDC096323 TaxID=3155822 RepID=UPI00332270F6